MNFLVTGGAGFIGSHLVENLLNEGHAVRVLDNFITGKRSNIEPFVDRIDFIEGDISDLDTARKAAKDIEVVLHHAAIASVPRSVDNPVESNTINADGTLAMLVAAKDAGVRRFVYAGSSSAYGDDPELPKREDMAPSPLSPYAISKLCGEMYCRVFYSLYGLETVVLRYFNVFGVRQDPNNEYAAVIPKFITAMLEGRSPVIFGDGLQSRDFSYVKNNVRANLLAANAPNAPGELINIACGESYTLLDLVEAINQKLGTDIKVEFKAERAGDIKHSVADITKAKAILGYKPFVTFHEGLAETIDSLYENQTTS